LQHYALFLLATGYHVTVFCARPDIVTEWIRNRDSGLLERFSGRSFEAEFRPLKRLFVFDLPVRCLRLWLTTARALKRAVKQDARRYDFVFFTWIDSYLAPLVHPVLIDFIFPFRWGGIYFHPGHLRAKHRLHLLRRGILRFDLGLRSRHCRAIALLDEGVLAKVKRLFPDKTCMVFADFIDDAKPDMTHPLIAEILAKANGRKIISLIGSLERRKGTLTFLRGATACSPEAYFFVLAGQLSKDNFTEAEKARLNEASTRPNYFCYYHWIPNENIYNAIIAISDALYLAYEQNYHSSNTITKAAFYRKPVIASDIGCVAERVKRYHLGICIREGDVAACTRALRSIVEKRQCGDASPDFEGLFYQHSVPLLKTQVQTLLNKAIP
jgi:glycosyltransferase involved in cell wall biosynthesis